MLSSNLFYRTRRKSAVIVVQSFRSSSGIARSDLSTGFIVLEHDLYQQAVDLAIGYTIPSAKAHQPPFNVCALSH